MRKLPIKKIGLAVLACFMILLLKNCDFRLMSNREVEEYLGKRYGQEFKVLSSSSVTDDYYTDDVWRVRLYVVSLKDDPETQFYVDTYSLDIFSKAFETRAADTDVEYSFSYFYPLKRSSVYYSDLYVNIEPVSSGNLEVVCAVLSQAYADTFEIVKDIPYGVSIMLTYREPAWPEDQSCLIRIDSFYLSGFDTNTEAIKEYILNEVNRALSR